MNIIELLFHLTAICLGFFSILGWVFNLPMWINIITSLPPMINLFVIIFYNMGINRERSEA